MKLKDDPINSKKNLLFFYPSLEIGGLTKNLFSLINSLSQKNYNIIYLIIGIKLVFIYFLRKLKEMMVE
mgnify:CR=1 FL=1